ncbi:MAG: Rieske 2Fe-2S domain-containing protein [Desulfurococcales archaeon]|nr:Rieske 2Fe-2S domain-containing protein [Desulfurococcales archaeon]
MAWARFARVKVIPEGFGRVKVVGGVPVIVVRFGGVFRAFVGVCPHKWYVLCDRAVRGGEIVCPGHGERFDVASGEPRVGKAREPLTSLRVEVRGEDVYVDLPEGVLERLVRATSGPD